MDLEFSSGWSFDYNQAFVCAGFFNSVADIGFFVGLLIDVLIIATYSACHFGRPGKSDFGFQMLVLEFIDAIPEAMFIGESVVDGTIALPVVLAILTLNVVNCFPVRDHEILTDRGFMSFKAVREHFQKERLLNVACYVSGRLEYRPITLDKVIYNHGSHRFVSASSSDSQLDLQPTENHRMWAALPGEKFSIHQAGELLGKRNSEASATFRTNFEAGAAADGFAKEIATELALETTDEVGAFLKLFGHWLNDGWLDGKEFRVCFGLTKPQDLGYLFAVLTKRLGASCHHHESGFSISDHGFWKFFASGCDHESTEHKGIPRWMWKLNKEELRLVIEGASLGGERELPAGGKILAPSLRYRDELLRLCLHAGYSVHFCVDREKGWAVEFTDLPRFATPQIPLHELGSVSEVGGVWCVSVPTKEQLIMVRRVLEWNDDGSVKAASRPFVVGNTMCTGFDLLAGEAADDEDIELDRVLRDHEWKSPIIYPSPSPHPHRRAGGGIEEQSLLTDSKGPAPSTPAQAAAVIDIGERQGYLPEGSNSHKKRSVIRFFLFCLINFSMGNILLSMMDEIYVEFEKHFENSPAGWLKNGSLILGTCLGTATVMLIIAGNAGMRSSGSCDCKCCGGGNPTFWGRLVLLLTSFFCVSLFAVVISGVCGLICKILRQKNVIVIQPLFEGFSGGAFVGAVAGIMIPETTEQLHKSGFTGAWTQMMGMIMFISGITIGMVTRELLFSINPVLWSYCAVPDHPEFV